MPAAARRGKPPSPPRGAKAPRASRPGARKASPAKAAAGKAARPAVRKATGTRAAPKSRAAPGGRGRASAARAAPSRPGATPVLLSGGNPQVAKGDGDGPVQAYIAAMPGWKSGVGRRLDRLIMNEVPHVRKAVKWNSPFYGVEGQGWFLSFHVFTRYVKVTFFRGTSLRPVPPGGTHVDGRWLDVHEDGFDERQMADWVRQAAAIPGWGNA